MSKFTLFLTVLILLVLSLQSNFAQGDQSSEQSFQFEVPQHIQNLQRQIKIAEDNENWELYYSLRPQLIEAWQNIKPEIALMYRNTNNPEMDNNLTDAPQYSNNSTPVESPLWGDDIIIESGPVSDISLVVTRSDTLYLAALNSSGSAVNIYRSGDGGLNWSTFKSNFSLSANKIELLDFDGFQGSSGPTYLLLFSQYTTGVLWCTRFETGTGSYVNSKVVDGGVSDFAVDRNYPGTNYRCFVIYDSAETQYRKRSDPASYATIWQDPVQITSCKDPDISYGFGGNLYSIYVGRISGNLYLNTNLNYGDPSSFGAQITLAQGTIDTTFLPEVIASRHDTANQHINAVYNKYSNTRPVLYRAYKLPGSDWVKDVAWVISPAENEHKNVNLFCRKANVEAQFQSVYVKSGIGNITPREVRYKKYSTNSWSGSIMISDSANTSTGLQNPYVVELNSGIAAFSFVGPSGNNVYFDREDWITEVTPENSTPESYSLQQNYPNPFNPNTKINFSIPEQTNVKLKIFNAIGQEVATIVNTELTAGNHTVDFNAASLSSGVYFYRIETPNFTSTKKMILMK